MSSKVVTYETSWTGDRRIDITPAQEQRLRSAGVWPHGEHGNAYTSVYYGLHAGRATFSDAEIGRLCAGEHAMDVLYGRQTTDVED